MITRNQIQFVKSLQQKKYRKEHAMFVVEGEKMVRELLASDYEISVIYQVSEKESSLGPDVESISNKDMQRISGLKNPSDCLAVAMQKNPAGQVDYTGITLILDDIKDPGNLGTIIRTSEWFGVRRIICSTDTVEAFNPKVVQSTMGSIFRMNIIYADLSLVMNELNQKEIPSYGAVLGGENYAKVNFPEDCALIIGSESHGISKDIQSLTKHLITIPGSSKAESLNAAVATGILLSHL